MTGEAKNVRFRLWQEIAVALVLKAILLAVIWMVWFSAPEDQAVDASTVNTRFFTQHTQ